MDPRDEGVTPGGTCIETSLSAVRGALRAAAGTCDTARMSAARKLDPHAIPESDPLWQALLRLPVTTEPVPPEELAAAEAALDDLLSGRVEAVPHEEVHAALERMRSAQDG